MGIVKEVSDEQKNFLLNQSRLDSERVRLTWLREIERQKENAKNAQKELKKQQKEKEKLLKEKEKERAQKEKALKEIERLNKLLKSSGIK